MTFKSIIKHCVVFCVTAILGIAVCGCEDLGAYTDTTEYYNSFGDIVLIEGTTRGRYEYSVEEYFYNEDSKEDFLAGEDGAYEGVKHSDYVYMAIPFESNIDMDTLALYIQSKTDVTVYISVYVTDYIPSNWKSISDNKTNGETISEQKSGDTPENKYDDPDPETKIGDVALNLKKDYWDSFVLDVFSVNGRAQQSIQINDGQYILLQIRNNSGIRVFDDKKQAYVDPQTHLELQGAEITMTNLLIRALEVEHITETQGGE